MSRNSGPPRSRFPSPSTRLGRIGAAIRAAKIGMETAEDQLRIYQQAALRDVTAAFQDVLLSKELYVLAVQNLEQKARTQKEARRKLAAGVATDYDVLAADVAVENARPDVIRTENLIRISREKLRFILGIEGQEVDAAGYAGRLPWNRERIMRRRWRPP